MLDKGSKYDLIAAMRKNSVSKAKFNHAYASLYGHSGGWLSATCPHGVVYACKFLLRSASPRDYADILRSFKHIPTVNVADIANMIAKITNRLAPCTFTPFDGKIVEDSKENV